ncbi:MAG TPA: xanthine dehydrogenase family protein molybdopterin-binding subunit [Thermomicrobiales bacterium]|nr:xanthine dehydrogenase family protein molybdopterin-binding subunit [Thermomicrobiales bacterium]
MVLAARTTTGHAVGQDVPRVDARAKATGETRYAGDLVVPGMVYGKILRSPYAHARIRRIDASRARRLPGVVAVLTGDDVLDINPYYGHAIKDRPLIAIDRVRFAGEPVVAVAAEDLATADEALTLIDVEYEELSCAVTLDAALAEGAPRLHITELLKPGLFHGLGELKPQPGNICYVHGFARGDVEDAFARAEVVVEGGYRFPAVYQYAMEPHTAIAQWSVDEVTVWSSCQHPFLVRSEIADLFGLPVANVRIVVPYLGGGFGSKSYTKMEPITVALARKARRPVRIANSVDEAMVTTRRHGMKAWVRTAATADGRLLAREVRAWFDTGAYADNGPRVVATGADAAPGPYRWDAVKVDAWGVYTNTSPAGSYRAFGATHLQWIGEAQVDEIARRCGLDAVQIRERNLLTPGESVRPGGKPLDADLIGNVKKIAEGLNWDSPKPPNVGRGVSVGLLAAGAHPVSTAFARMEADGIVTLYVSSTEVGQGARTVFSQIVAEELALPVDRVKVVGSDTQVTPYDRSTGASRSTTLAGLAVQRAAQELRAQLLSIAARLYDLPEMALAVRDGAVWHEGEATSYPDLIRAHFGMVGGELIGRGEVRPENNDGSYAAGPVFWEVCIGGAEVEVDPDTGRLTVRKAVSVADVGKAINPKLVEAQEMGGVLQGLGNAIHEEMLYDPDTGQLLNGTLFDYHVPTIEDLPGAFVSTIVENADGPGPYGAKGVGEGSLAGATAAVVTALGDLGIRVTELPATPERVWRWLQNAVDSRG